MCCVVGGTEDLQVSDECEIQIILEIISDSGNFKDPTFF
jgi:hypothetical protein